MSATSLRNIDLTDACTDAEHKLATANPLSARQFQRNCQSMPGGNTRSLLHYAPFPLTIARAEGAHLWDLDGHRYVDFVGEYGAALFGHSHPVLVEAITAAVSSGLLAGGPGEYEGQLAQLLCDRFPSLDLVRFCNSGTEANLFAFGTARVHTGRDVIMVFDGGYHGGAFRFHGDAPLNVPFPYLKAPFNDIDATRALIVEHADKLALVAVEPMQAGGGCIPATTEFLTMLREETRARGIVLLFDEVVTSRMGLGGVQARIGVVPDMTTLGKYIGGGFAIGVFGGSHEIMARFDPRVEKPLYHAGTFNQNRLSMSAGYAAMSQVFTQEVASQLFSRGERLRAALVAAIRARDLPMCVTGMGSVMQVHFVRGPIQSTHDAARSHPRAKHLMYLDLLAQGFMPTPRSMLVCSLPLEDQEVDAFIAAFEIFLDERIVLLRAPKT